MPLVPFPDRDTPLFLVNPEHVSLLVPSIAHKPAPVFVHVRVKIQGVPEMTVNLGEYPTEEAALQRWKDLPSLLGNVAT
ncbi:hypothetical protein [Leifsonia aquatica]|uniref:hypothetical protein n=1 Tax=Leifsonia aquatica TaxID=144185 RepID=UPI0028A8EB19|nr:hypothetical protein [Leifsonia aquatica]